MKILINYLDSQLGEIQKAVEKKLYTLKKDILKCIRRFGDFGMAPVVENLFVGLPLPNFLQQHEAGLMGKLASGLGGFFGSKPAPSTPRGRFSSFKLSHSKI